MESKMEKTDNVEDKKAEDAEPLLQLQQLLQQQSLQMQQNQTELATLRQQVQELGERQHAGLIPQPQHQLKHQPPHQSPHQPPHQPPQPQHQPTHPTYHSPLAGLYGPEQPTAYRSEQRLFRQRRRDARRLWRQSTCRDGCGRGRGRSHCPCSGPCGCTHNCGAGRSSCSCCCGRHT
uniref:putative cyclin-dependent serine/threonine-protein kinase DDB_G0272797/DDB_G0274007 n=1 Tax=Osmia lignaria TaxID=473952 RepID=UPI0014787A1C|nr:putative cyclin-dependent serine/threonine-protein kinase DDB_G0272797/DDB_G0274007 [Osmia lignaria]